VSAAQALERRRSRLEARKDAAASVASLPETDRIPSDALRILREDLERVRHESG